jgi:hypothetical protein
MDERCFENKKDVLPFYTHIFLCCRLHVRKRKEKKIKGNETEIRMKRKTPRVLEKSKRNRELGNRIVVYTATKFLSEAGCQRFGGTYCLHLKGSSGGKVSLVVKQFHRETVNDQSYSRKDKGTRHMETWNLKEAARGEK